MSRYIDADVLIENLKNDITGKNLIRLYNLDGFINAQPTIDAVPVVRCGECKHKYLEHDVWMCLFGLMMPSPDGFCSYGEKVDE